MSSVPGKKLMDAINGPITPKMSTATPEDVAAIDRLIKPEEPPERIYGWLQSQMSIARFYGGLRYKDRQYFISEMEEGTPLVRADVLQRENREKADRLKADRKAQKLAAKQAQGDLL